MIKCLLCNGILMVIAPKRASNNNMPAKAGRFRGKIMRDYKTNTYARQNDTGWIVAMLALISLSATLNLAWEQVVIYFGF